MSSSAEVRLWTMSTIAQKGTSKEKTHGILREVEGTPMEEGEEETVLVALPMGMGKAKEMVMTNLTLMILRTAVIIQVTTPPMALK